MGKVLRVNLSTQEITTQEYPQEMLQKYLGGSGLGARILLEETTAETAPLGPDNVLIFMTGPLVNTKALNSGRYQVITKSPLTGVYGEANAGGSWGVHLKRAGYDGIVIVGKSHRPVYLLITNTNVEIKDASDIWGKDTYQTDLILKEKLGCDIVVSCIGQAGENLVKFAAIINDGIHARAAARCGVGAVMGSKRLKAVAVQGRMKPHIADKKALQESIRFWIPKIRARTMALNKFGTSEMMPRVEEFGDLPVKNWRQGVFHGAKKLTEQITAGKIYTKGYYCTQCVIGCGKKIQVKEGPYAGLKGAGPEYETISMLGTNCLIDDFAALAKANDLCNAYGLDTISTGAVIAFAMEAFERGILSDKQTGGLKIKWGNPEVLLNLIEMIAFRDGLGNLLAEGVRIASKALGPLAEEFAPHVKGLELPGHDPRAKFSNALAYATSPRGACHMNAFSYEFERDRFSPKGKAQLVASFQNLMAVFDSLIICKFILFGLQNKSVEVLTEWLNEVTGWNLTGENLFEIGERIVNLKRIYNIHCGLLRKDDDLPARILNEELDEGGAAGKIPHLEKMLSEYYDYRGWDEVGIPRKETLERLALL